MLFLPKTYHEAELVLKTRISPSEHAFDVNAAIDIATDALEKMQEFEKQEITIESALDTSCTLAGAEGEIEKLQEKLLTMTRLAKGEWVETEDVCNALDMTFTEAFKLFDFSRTADWWSVVGETEEERAREGQCIKTMFRVKGLNELSRYKNIGTEHEFKTCKSKATAQTVTLTGDGYADGHLVYDTYDCPCCGATYELEYEEYECCPKCGQKMTIPKLTESEDTCDGD